MDKFSRKDLKSDRFALEVGHGVDFVTDHRKQFVQYGAIALAAVLLVAGIAWYRSYQHGVRQEALTEAFTIQNATVGPPPNEYVVAFPSQTDKDRAVDKAFSNIATKYSGSDEAAVAEYYLGAASADKGDMAQAEKRFKLVMDAGEKDYSALAKLSLAQIYTAQGKVGDAEKLVRSLIDHPTTLVSKEQAIIALARVLAPTKPVEARKLLEPLRANERSAVSRAALSALSEIPQK